MMQMLHKLLKYDTVKEFYTYCWILPRSTELPLPL